MKTAVFNSHTRYNEDLAKGDKLPTRLTYPKHHDKKFPYDVIGLEITNESKNFFLLLADVHKHGPNAKKHALIIVPGESTHFGNYGEGKAVGMCYELHWIPTPAACALRDCEEVVIEGERGLFIIEEYEKDC